MESSLFMIGLIIYFGLRKALPDLLRRIRCVRSSLPEARWISFRYKVIVQTDAKIAGVDAFIKGDNIFLSYESVTLPNEMLRALLLHEVGHKIYQSQCQMLADHFALKHSQVSAYAFVCLTRRLLEKDPHNLEIRSRAIRAVKYYQATYGTKTPFTKAS